MFEGRRVAVVVPAKDESHWIGGVVDTMASVVDDVIVVDDGSADDTGAIARSKGALVLRNDVARGVGAAIVRGYRAALDRGAEVVAVMAGDGQMCPDDLPALLEPVVRGRADYAKGDRFRHPDAGHIIPRARRIVGGWLSTATGLATGISGLSDSQCGYTVISRRALLELDLDALWTGYGYPNDLLGRLARAKLRVVDVPVRPVYRGEASGLKPRHVARIVTLIGRAALLRFTDAVSSRHDAPARPTGA